ncbi:sodium/potassium-transporting ATPase subunit beta-2-like isoform X2 [Leguminivora glycinivorella]|uniref:sodium/potassium-transporting ATPase subunit beta-2-like isoform X2 n=1 Tax=Leguminivora glycinivorella TaxID=1035111 RepID=UPI0020107759|nr:sodium/potassium-transporting ATPase subunit beta-2-like isoform X2 [Leguminivora glycinivorella]
MALQKRTVKIIAITVIALIIIGALLGIILGLVLRSDKVELEVWPRGADGGKEPKISYKVSDNNTFLPWIRRLNDTLSEYNKIRTGSNAGKLVQCNYHTVLNKDQVCDVNVNLFYPCTAANNYNYQNGKPCVFLKLNKVANWVPNLFNTTESLPASMPLDLKQAIKPQSGKPEMNQVWVSCEGVSQEDKDSIGSLQYIPNSAHGFPSYYFPYAKQEAYLSPFVVVLFENPTLDKPINVVCKAWAKNIVDKNEQVSIRFQLKVDS